MLGFSLYPLSFYLNSPFKVLIFSKQSVDKLTHHFYILLICRSFTFQCNIFLSQFLKVLLLVVCINVKHSLIRFFLLRWFHTKFSWRRFLMSWMILLIASKMVLLALTYQYFSLTSLLSLQVKTEEYNIRSLTNFFSFCSFTKFWRFTH